MERTTARRLDLSVLLAVILVMGVAMVPPVGVAWAQQATDGPPPPPLYTPASINYPAKSDSDKAG